MKIYFLSTAILLLLCLVSANFAQEKMVEKTFEIKGSLIDQEKEILAGSNLFFECGNLKFTTVTDENGKFAIKLPIGKCKITLNEAVSKTFAAFIEISESHLNPSDFEMIVQRNSNCCGQTTKGDIAEVINAVVPPFPAAAKAVRASGEVVVLVKINRDGKVISSTAENGHPLLRRTSEIVAREWLFSSNESELEREGKIVFAFINGDKEGDSSQFMKPNRLEIFSEKLYF